jgi:hypothetical protein
MATQAIPPPPRCGIFLKIGGIGQVANSPRGSLSLKSLKAAKGSHVTRGGAGGKVANFLPIP